MVVLNEPQEAGKDVSSFSQLPELELLQNIVVICLLDAPHSPHFSLQITPHPLQAIDVHSIIIDVHKSVRVIHSVMLVAQHWKGLIGCPFICYKRK